MAVLTVRNVPDEVHRALRARATLRGRSTEAEVRAILEETVLPEGKRRNRLNEDLEQQVLPMFAGHVLAFDPAGLKIVNSWTA
ncbi:MAG: hypothetical protein OXI10_04535 [Gammaproteobacteria bacterium]|nr:hypothetical protein [Gammaproteobacteria bacterium]MDE0714125.1 hypothetical protein [Gammaproteobacteria bacterium]